MFNEVEGLIQKTVSGEIDRSSVSTAANDHVSSMNQSELTQHLQTAADNANQNGQSGIAQQILAIVEKDRSNPEALKQDAIQLIQSNPQILSHFAPDFAKSILGRL